MKAMTEKRKAAIVDALLVGASSERQEADLPMGISMEMRLRCEVKAQLWDLLAKELCEGLPPDRVKGPQPWERGYWFCATCKKRLEWYEVTFEETHDSRTGGCGNSVGWRETTSEGILPVFFEKLINPPYIFDRYERALCKGCGIEYRWKCGEELGEGEEPRWIPKTDHHSGCPVVAVEHLLTTHTSERMMAMSNRDPIAYFEEREDLLRHIAALESREGRAMALLREMPPLMDMHNYFMYGAYGEGAKEASQWLGKRELLLAAQPEPPDPKEQSALALLRRIVESIDRGTTYVTPVFLDEARKLLAAAPEPEPTDDSTARFWLRKIVNGVRSYSHSPTVCCIDREIIRKAREYLDKKPERETE